MVTRLFAPLLGLGLSVGCVAKESIADNPDTESSGADEGGGSEADDAGGDEMDGGTGASPGGPTIVDGVVDCSTIPPGGPTVAGSALNELGFPEAHCNPRFNPYDPDAEYNCCSVDPAAKFGDLPAYEGKNITGETPYFSGINNELSSWGMCVRTSDIPFGSGLQEPVALNCPVPCNPTWSDDEIASVCGGGRVCCQTHPLEPEDCVVDHEFGGWRPVRGEDIGTSDVNGEIVTDWSPLAHATHQDPSGTACIQHAEGDQSSLDFNVCIAQLNVADQRGVCMALGPAQVCPHLQPDFVDACEQL